MIERLEVHNHLFEFTRSATGLPPDDTSGMSLNNTVTFWRLDGGKWHRAPRGRLELEARGLIEFLMEWDLIDSARS